ncbi:hypothetical protein GBA52_010556 [Prunus armeniaca]|nr:hypothetical protein GBA52_010556 [Prunus armeniaca]
MEVMSKINLNKQLRMEKPHVVVKEEEEEDEEFDHHQQLEDHDKKKKGIVGGSGSVKRSGTSGGGTRCCQADRCPADLSDAKQYHRRHKVCDLHSKAQVVLVSGLRQRFCQQCSRFHELPEFDDTKRSCRRRLAGHNERRRKNSVESHAEGPSRDGTGAQLKDGCGHGDNSGRIRITIQGNSAYKHFQIR